MRLRKKYLILAMGTTFAVPVLHAADTQLDFTDPLRVNSQAGGSISLGQANKTKMDRFGTGVLVMTYGDAVEGAETVYDVKEQAERPARDNFMRTCDSITTDCSIESNWSVPVNVTSTAVLSSMSTDWDGPETDGVTTKPFYGDSGKPNVKVGGAHIQVSWADKYCPGGAQRSVNYLTRDSREIPFSCTWVRKGKLTEGAVVWQEAVQLSNGERDAKQDANAMLLTGDGVVSWQEDPLGLSLGEGDGPGEGASGATASHGTDVWLATTTASTAYTSGVRLTDNATSKASGSYGDIKNSTGTILEADAIEGGSAAATRANVAIVVTNSQKNIVIAYEESKGSEGLDDGKYVRYHTVPFANVATEAAGDGKFLEVGCIISNPLENARRVRFIPQSDEGMAKVSALQEQADSGLRMGIFWKEGEPTAGGPSDIMIRLAYNGVGTDNMVPAIDTAKCEVVEYVDAENIANAPALNLSSNTVDGTNALADNTDTNPFENALAHRGAIVGNDLYLGYSYTDDWALATYTTLTNYDFWVRHYDATLDTNKTGTVGWSDAQNVSNLPTKEMNVREPRFVKTPYSAVEEAGYNPNAFMIAWGLQTNVASHIESAEELDIIYTRSFDKGLTFEPLVRIANEGGSGRYESQLRPTPDGKTLYAAWNENDFVTEESKAMFAVATTTDQISIENPYVGLRSISYSGEVPSTNSSSGGCSLTENAKFDPVLPAILAAVLAFFGYRRFRKNS